MSAQQTRTARASFHRKLAICSLGARADLCALFIYLCARAFNARRSTLGDFSIQLAHKVFHYFVQHSCNSLLCACVWRACLCTSAKLSFIVSIRWRRRPRDQTENVLFSVHVARRRRRLIFNAQVSRDLHDARSKYFTTSANSDTKQLERV